MKNETGEMLKNYIKRYVDWPVQKQSNRKYAVYYFEENEMYSNKDETFKHNAKNKGNACAFAAMNDDPIPIMYLRKLAFQKQPEKIKKALGESETL
jgi:hypothetical protein